MQNEKALFFNTYGDLKLPFHLCPSPLNLNYPITGRVIIRTETETGQVQGRYPDLVVVDRTEFRI